MELYNVNVQKVMTFLVNNAISVLLYQPIKDAMLDYKNIYKGMMRVIITHLKLARYCLNHFRQL